MTLTKLVWIQKKKKNSTTNTLDRLKLKTKQPTQNTQWNLKTIWKRKNNLNQNKTVQQFKNNNTIKMT